MPGPQKTLSELHRDVAIFYVEHSLDPLDLLGESSRIFPEGLLSHIISRYQISFEFASWMPQWIVKITGLELFPKHFTTAQGIRIRIYNPWGLADHTSLSDGDVHRQVKILGSTLIAQAFPIDHIKSTAEVPCLANDHTEARELIRRWAPTNRNAIYYPTGEINMTAFLRSIVMDLADGIPPTERGGLAAWDYDADKLVSGDANDNEGSHSTHRCKMRNLAMSGNGYMALVFLEARAGDVIFALRGGSMLYVLRPKGDEYVFIGECYVHGLMDGEALKLLEEDAAVIQEVRII